VPLRSLIHKELSNELSVFRLADEASAAVTILLQKPLDLALQNDFRVLVVVPLWLT
jgi:hypothetical protein